MHKIFWIENLRCCIISMIPNFSCFHKEFFSQPSYFFFKWHFTAKDASRRAFYISILKTCGVFFLFVCLFLVRGWNSAPYFAAEISSFSLGRLTGFVLWPSHLCCLHTNAHNMGLSRVNPSTPIRSCGPEDGVHYASALSCTFYLTIFLVIQEREKETNHMSFPPLVVPFPFNWPQGILLRARFVSNLNHHRTTVNILVRWLEQGFPLSLMPS